MLLDSQGQHARRPDQQPEPRARALRGHLLLHAQRDHRHRGSPLLRELGRRRARHRPRARPGRAQPPDGAGRLDHRPAVRQERAARAVRPHRLPEDARGRARLPPHAQVVQEQDPHAVPQLDLLRQRRLRRRVRGAHLLRQPARPPGLRHARRHAVRQGAQARGGRAHRRRGRQPDGLRPRRPPAGGPGAAQPRAQGHVRPGPAAARGVPQRARRGAPGARRHQAAHRADQGALLHDLGAPAARRPVRRPQGVRGRAEGEDDARPQAPGRGREGGQHATCPIANGPVRGRRRDRQPDRRGARDGRRARLRHAAVQPRHAGPAPAGLGDQAVHPRLGAQEGLRAGLAVAVAQARLHRARHEGAREVRGQQLREQVRGLADARRAASPTPTTPSSRRSASPWARRRSRAWPSGWASARRSPRTTR